VTKHQLPSIEGERIILRLLKREDLSHTLSWRNQDDIRKWFRNTAIISVDSHYTWFEQYLELDNDYIFLIIAKNLNSIPIGQISIYNINWDAKTAEFGRLLIGEPRAKGRGLAKEATRLLLDYAFNTFGLQKIVLEVKNENTPAKAVYLDTGFIEISRKDDFILMAIQKDIY